MGFFDGGGGQFSSSMSGSNTISGPVPGSPYEVFQNQQLNKIGDLSDRPYQWYDVNKFGPMSNEQQAKGWNMLEQAGSMWQPYFNRASGVLDKANAIDPGVAFGRAMNTPTALDAANPWTQKAGQSWGDVSSSYMNPYINDVINNTNQLQSKNFLENVMPGISNTFVASGGGLGGKNYGKDMNWALTNFNDSLNRTNTASLADEWNKAAGIFGNDASRWAGLSNTVGNQATADRAGWTNLGTAQTGQIGALTALGGQYGNLGTGALGNQITGAQAQLQSGNERQNIENWKNQFNYDQFRQQQDDPYKKAAFASSTANQYTWPMRQNTQGWQTTQQSASSSSSPFSQILGGLATVGSLAGTGGLGSMFGGLGSMFGGMGSGSSALGSVMYGSPANAMGSMSYGGPRKRGGHIKPCGYFSGGPVGRARGGYLGLDAPSFPPTIPNPAYFKWMDSAAFRRGGDVKCGHFAQGGKALGSALGSLAGNFLLPGIGGMLGNIGGSLLGSLLPFATGGHVPVVRAANASNDRRLAAMRSKAQSPAGGVNRQLAFPSPAVPTRPGFFS